MKDTMTANVRKAVEAYRKMRRDGTTPAAIDAKLCPALTEDGEIGRYMTETIKWSSKMAPSLTN